jgi:hypothetical protein
LCIFMGVFPIVFLKPMEPAINKVIDRVHSREAAVIAADPAPRTPDPGPRQTSDND